MIMIKFQLLWKPSPQINLCRRFLQENNSTLGAEIKNGNFVKIGITSWVECIIWYATTDSVLAKMYFISDIVYSGSLSFTVTVSFSRRTLLCGMSLVVFSKNKTEFCQDYVGFWVGLTWGIMNRGIAKTIFPAFNKVVCNVFL
jgi:hypothetical protein